MRFGGARGVDFHIVIHGGGGREREYAKDGTMKGNTRNKKRTGQLKQEEDRESDRRGFEGEELGRAVSRPGQVFRLLPQSSHTSYLHQPHIIQLHTIK